MHMVARERAIIKDRTADWPGPAKTRSLRVVRIATWNVNSIRAREARVLKWLEQESVDTLCLQELKVTEEHFPFEAITERGYHSTVYGQRTYNGVAILSRSEPVDVRRGMGDDDPDPQARLVSARIDGVLVLSAYFPNGKMVGSDAYGYKLQWMERLRDYLDAIASPADPVVLAGDFNVAPEDVDAANPERWAESVLCHESAREALERLRGWGFVDIFRERHPEGGLYSWWDYRMLGFPKNDGLRIDHVFATDVLAARSRDARIDRDQRKGGKTDKPSDHAPVIVDFSR